MYIRLAREKPFMSGKAVRRSWASRSMTLAPQRGALLGGVDAMLQLGQPFGIACRYGSHGNG